MKVDAWKERRYRERTEKVIRMYEFVTRISRREIRDIVMWFELGCPRVEFESDFKEGGDLDGFSKEIRKKEKA